MSKQLVAIVTLSIILVIANAVIIDWSKEVKKPMARTITTHACNFDENCPTHDYRRVGRAKTDDHISFTIWTRQNNFADECGSRLMDVSDPDSPNYGKHYSFEDIGRLVYDEEAINAITAYLDEHGVRPEDRYIPPNGDYIRVNAHIDRVEQMFNSEFHVFFSEDRDTLIRRSKSFTIPEHLAPFVTHVSGIADFPMYFKRGEIVPPFLARKTDGTVTPDLIAKVYKMPNETVSDPKSDMGVFESLDQNFSPDDLKQFQKTYNIPFQEVKTIIGPNDPSTCRWDPDSCAEANLDVQYIMAMAQGAPLTYYSIPYEWTDIFVIYAEMLAKDPDPPLVHSISYGGPEHLQDQDAMVQFNNEVCKLGLRGLTIFVASGDDGVAGYEARNRPGLCGFVPDYPSNCPYVTSVGATMGPENGKKEIACTSDKGSIITTGGGFSEKFARPSYQNEAVEKYLKTPQIPPTNLFNSKGRGYPDVAALGNLYNVVIGGQTYLLSGTSASSPVFCAMVALVNGDREVRGKSPLGFLNPVLYKIDETIYNDIDEGTNNCVAGQAPVCCKYGFTAYDGWDAVTGWGSINYERFADELADL